MTASYPPTQQDLPLSDKRTLATRLGIYPQNL